MRIFNKPNLQKVHCQFSLKAITHLHECMIWFIAKKFNPHNVPVDRKQVKKLVLVYFLKQKLCQGLNEKPNNLKANKMKNVLHQD